MKRKGIFILVALASFLLVLAWSCENWMQTESEGNLIVNITDAPFDISYIESASVTISKIEIRIAGANDTVPFITLSDNPVSFDLMKLRNGLVENLVNMNIPVGEYDEIRIVTSEANLKVKDGDLYSLKIPSGPQTGIKLKIKPAISVQGGLTSELLLDFDLSRSFVLKGNLNQVAEINGFNFKPVVRAVNNSYAGSIEGKVTDITQNKLVNASVMVWKDTLLSTAFTDTLGKYAFLGIPAGTYKMIAAKENFDTLVFEGVRVVAGNRTVRNFSLKPE